MSNEVKRHRFPVRVDRPDIARKCRTRSASTMVETDFVLASDYDALEAECSRLRAALGQYADDNNWCYDTCNISRDVAKDALAAGGGCI